MRLFNKFFGGLIKLFGIVSILLVCLLVFATLGYKAANQETKVASINIIPTQLQQFKAIISWQDGTTQEYQISGDEFYVDAKVLKWKDWVSFFGIKTWYEFDRIGGRYRSVQDEKTKPRTLYQLSVQKDLDLYYLRKKYPFLSNLVDADYGSAAFFLANTTKKIDLYVARTGLMVRTQEGDQPPNLTVE